MTFPRLALVEAPVYDAAVLYEFNIDQSAFVEHDGVDFGVPEWSAAPGAVGGEDGYRTVAFTHLASPDYAVAWQELTILSRLLLSQQQWLLIQMSQASAPRWYKTWRSTPASLSPDLIQKKTDGDLAGLWGIALSLTADPYLYGEQVSLPSVSIASDPFAAVNPMYAVLPAIEGDAPAPLVTRVSAASARTCYPMLGTAPAAPVVVDIATPGASFPNLVTDATLAGGSGIGWSMGVGGNGVSPTITVPVDMAAGTYRVLARIRTGGSGAASVAQIGISQHIGGGVIDMPMVTLTDSSGTSATVDSWVDLGPVLYPPAHNDELPYVGPPPDKLRQFYLGATRVSGDAQLVLDAVMFLPVQLTPVYADTAREAVTFSSLVALGGSVGDVLIFGDLVVDGEAERIPLQQYSVAIAALSGVFPQVHPGQPNLLVWVPRLSRRDLSGSDLANTVDVACTYTPRYLWPAP